MNIGQICAEIERCATCEIRKSCRNVVAGDLGDNLDILFVGEAPGEEEDIQKHPFVGRSGQLLRAMLGYLNRYKIGITNAVKCRPPNNRTPTFGELQECHKWTEKIIQHCKPKTIVCVGKPALTIIAKQTGKNIGHLATMSKLAGSEFFAKKYNATIYTIYHPAFVLRNKSKKIDLETQIIYLAKAMPNWIERSAECAENADDQKK